jgi:uncharacterized protein involved in tolerance to divalent cations
MGNKDLPISGKDALATLEVDASSELKRARQLVEEAVGSDIRAYLGGLGAKDVQPQSLTGLVTAAVAGGQWGFNSLVTRLLPLNLKIKDLDNAANEILTLIYRHTSILNYARIRVTSVQSIVKALLGKSVGQETKEDLGKVLNYRITNYQNLIIWSEMAEKCYQDFVLSSGQVSTRSISTYSKLWKSYVEERLTLKLGLKSNSNKEDFISERLKPVLNYKSPSSSQVEKLILESDKQYNFESQTNSIRKNTSTSKLVTFKKDLGGRTLQISYNMNGIDPELIQPVLNSIKGQLIIDPKQNNMLIDMSSETSQVIIEIEKPKKEDLDTIKIQLGALATAP